MSEFEASSVKFVYGIRLGGEVRVYLPLVGQEKATKIVCGDVWTTVSMNGETRKVPTCHVAEATPAPPPEVEDIPTPELAKLEPVKAAKK